MCSCEERGFLKVDLDHLRYRANYFAALRHQTLYVIGQVAVSMKRFAKPLFSAALAHTGA